jgi:signal recognition particle subunit SRP54
MTGQDAVNVAEQFSQAVDFDGVVMSKLDGDARGGAALSVKQVTGKPILYASTGEKLGDFEKFHPDRMSQRILGMGDVLSSSRRPRRRSTRTARPSSRRSCVRASSPSRTSSTR